MSSPSDVPRTSKLGLKGRFVGTFASPRTKVGSGFNGERKSCFSFFYTEGDTDSMDLSSSRPYVTNETPRPRKNRSRKVKRRPEFLRVSNNEQYSEWSFIKLEK